MTLTNGGALKTQTHMHKIYANPKAKYIKTDHSCSLNPEIFKLIKKATEKISEGTPLHMLYKVINIEYCIPCNGVGVGDSI